MASRTARELALGLLKALLFCPLPLFLAAGTSAWAAGWLFVAIFLVGTLAITIMLARRDPALLQERIKGIIQDGQPAWDKRIIVASVYVWLSWLVLIGLDAVRFGWSSVPSWLQVVGIIGVVAAWIACYWVFYENTFLAPVVRVQSEREHHVVASGPYAFVRHPMYAAAVLFFAATPMALGSWWGLAGSAVLSSLVVLRTILEERALRRGLAGYADYAARVRYRFVPLIW
jgi:protein-S-isoprenylcysteine O-methyltransferase Ste14